MSIVPAICPESENPLSFGFKSQIDGSRIQVFTLERDARNRLLIERYPQDENVLEVESFYLYLKAKDSLEHTFKLSLWALETKTVYIEQDGQTIKQEITDYTKNLGNYTDSLSNDSPRSIWDTENEYAVIRINTDAFPAFKQNLKKEKVLLEYNELHIEFFHWTNPALLEVENTVGNLFMLWLFYILTCLGFTVLWIALFGSIYIRIGTWGRANFGVIYFALSLLVGAFLIVAFFSGADEKDILREAVQVNLFYIIAICTFIIGFYTPAAFVPKHRVANIIKYDPTKINLAELNKRWMGGKSLKTLLDNTPVGHERLDAVPRGSKTDYYRDARSYVEIIAHVIHKITRLVNVEDTHVLHHVEPHIEQYSRFQRLKFKLHLAKRDRLFEVTDGNTSTILDDLELRKLQQQNSELQRYGYHLVSSNSELIFCKKFVWKARELKDTLFNRYIQNALLVIATYMFSFVFLIFFNEFINNFIVVSICAAINTIAFLFWILWFTTRNYVFLELTPSPRGFQDVINDSKHVEKMERTLGVLSDRVERLQEDNSQLRQGLLVDDCLHWAKDVMHAEKKFFPRNYAAKFKDALISVKDSIQKNKREVLDSTKPAKNDVQNETKKEESDE